MVKGALFVAFVSSLAAGSGFAQSLDPVGQKAAYVVDTNRQRTSSVIRNGSFSIQVDSEVETGFQSVIQYDLNVVMQGRQQGTENLVVPKEYFSPEFIANLRERTIYVTDNFKVKHMGYGEARLPDGTTYPHSDKIMIYDVVMPENTWIGQLIVDLALDQAHFDGKALVPIPLENIVVNAMVAQGVPVLGAVKIDLSGKYNGMNIKVGADYQVPRNP